MSRTPAVNSKNAQFAQRRTSSNTDVVAMDTVDITDRGAIEQGNDPYQSNKTAVKYFLKLLCAKSDCSID